MAGTSADDFGLASITWTNDRGGSGSVSGTTAWSVASVALQPGTNVVTVTATDEAGNRGTDAVRVVSDARKPNVTIAQPVTSCDLCGEHGHADAGRRGHRRPGRHRSVVVQQPRPQRRGHRHDDLELRPAWPSTPASTC